MRSVDVSRVSTLAAVGLLIALALTVPCHSEENPDDRRLLDALRSDDFDAREAAKKKLLERGDAVRAMLGEELTKTDLDADYKEYLKAIAGKLKDADVMKAFDHPKRIDLSVKKETVNAVFVKLKDHFGFSAQIKGPAGDKEISLELKNASFFEAVDAVRKAANLMYDRDELRQMMFNARNTGAAAPLWLRENGDANPSPCAAKGPVLVLFDSINVNLSRNILFGNEGKRNINTQKSFNLQGWVVTEQDLHFSGIGISSLTASSDKQETLGPGNAYINSSERSIALNNSFRLYNFNASYSPQIDVPATLNWKMGVKIRVPIKLTEKRLDKLADIKDKPQEFMNGTFVLKTVQNEAGRWKLSFETTGALVNLRAGHRMGRFGNDNEQIAPGNPELAGGITILDASNKPIESSRSSSHSRSSTSLVDSAEFDFEPRAILLRLPTQTETREFEVEIPQVPVP